ncbi:MAG: hypothetical protein HYY87_01275 [Candidatus Levybacteria bacterium]|nr:hypothetical protein [Candidatus Levybacteria bacterium]
MRVFVGILVGLALYTLFWLYFFKAFPFSSKKPNPSSLSFRTTSQPTTVPQDKRSEVLSVQTEKEEELPKSYSIDIIPRQQSFNLSCEFAAAASIIYHFTGDSSFSPQNEYEAEKTLMAKVGV